MAQKKENKVIEINAMHKWFGTFHVLKNINLEVSQGERIVICGPSGSGKSTLIRCINALNDIDSGSIKVHGIDNMNKYYDPRLKKARLEKLLNKKMPFSK